MTVKLKLFCQELCKKHFGWDDVLDERSKKVWASLQHELRESEPIHVQRWYFEGIQSEILTTSLEGFCDASMTAYADVVYLKIVTTDGVYLRLVTSKTKVALLVKQSTPRLELLSALILARLVTHVKEALKGFVSISSVRCWTDLEVALY